MKTFLDLLQEQCVYIKDCDSYIWKIDYEAQINVFYIWSRPAQMFLKCEIGYELFQEAESVDSPDRKVVKKYQFVYRNVQGINVVSERFLSVPEADNLYGLDCAPLLWTEVEV